MSNGSNASGTPDVASETPNVSDAQNAGKGLSEKRRRRDQGPDEAIEDLD